MHTLIRWLILQVTLTLTCVPPFRYEECQVALRATDLHFLLCKQ